MLINHNREKQLNAIIFFLKHTKFCGKTKLFKLLYYLDFFHFRETGRPVTGFDYYAWDFGPVPVALYKEIDNPPADLRETVNIPAKIPGSKTFTAMQPRKPFDKKYFTKRELRILDMVSYIFKEAKADQIVDASHLPNEPWDKTIRTKGEKALIDYMLAVDGFSTNSLSTEEIIERLEDRKELVGIFGEKRNGLSS